MVKNVQESGFEALLHLLQEECPVRTAVVNFTPGVDLDGNLNIHVRVDKRMVAARNAPGGLYVIAWVRFTFLYTCGRSLRLLRHHRN
jgi:hypothetical protein